MSKIKVLAGCDFLQNHLSQLPIAPGVSWLVAAQLQSLSLVFMWPFSLS
jgi:hypothetical protein